MLCRLPCYVAVLVSGVACRAMPCHLLPLLGIRAISIFYQFIQFLGAVVDGEVERMFTFISSFHLLLTQQSTCGPAFMLVYYLPSSSAPPPLPCSRGGRPVSAKPIVKQNPKIYLPVSSPSLMSKHSNRSRKSVAGPQFLLTMICCHLSAAFSVAKI